MPNRFEGRVGIQPDTQMTGERGEKPAVTTAPVGITPDWRPGSGPGPLMQDYMRHFGALPDFQFWPAPGGATARAGIAGSTWIWLLAGAGLLGAIILARRRA